MTSTATASRSLSEIDQSFHVIYLKSLHLDLLFQVSNLLFISMSLLLDLGLHIPDYCSQFDNKFFLATIHPLVILRSLPNWTSLFGQ